MHFGQKWEFTKKNAISDHFIYITQAYTGVSANENLIIKKAKTPKCRL